MKRYKLREHPQQIEEVQTEQWSKEKVQRDKQ
jgi:hypothetical protein